MGRTELCVTTISMILAQNSRRNKWRCARASTTATRPSPCLAALSHGLQDCQSLGTCQRLTPCMDDGSPSQAAKLHSSKRPSSLACLVPLRQTRFRLIPITRRQGGCSCALISTGTHVLSMLQLPNTPEPSAPGSQDITSTSLWCRVATCLESGSFLKSTARLDFSGRWSPANAFASNAVLSLLAHTRSCDSPRKSMARFLSFCTSKCPTTQSRSQSRCRAATTRLSLAETMCANLGKPYPCIAKD